jgi:tetratricopeptide (TPR) repeat protein
MYYVQFLKAESNFRQLELNPNDSVAFTALKSEARNDNVWAIVRLAEVYMNGLRATEDQDRFFERGLEMIVHLAEQGFAFAQYKLADHYITCGKRKKAIRLLKECLEAHIPEAALLLSNLLQESDPSEADEYRELARRWGAFDLKGSEPLVDDDLKETTMAPSRSSMHSEKKQSISDIFDEFALKGFPIR